ncbi:hypothetical protein CCACVL1_14747 [Corchorus capsularis]|uniref:Uncharacterized protein n=1 Tax=Corchorus capsularis TaxID=210143 RepID=A0A1R3I5Q5_COCAP|nr:hypothetical protein CCACVL1_18236 [Corchorus capsularis]OMO77900.1 hypothetical protein CCACVL1_14747 [Corchorus capsularis]
MGLCGSVLGGQSSINTDWANRFYQMDHWD